MKRGKARSRPPGPRPSPRPRTALALLALLAAPCAGLDLRHGWRYLEELAFLRAGEPVGPGDQSLVLAPAPGPGTDWPARLAETERTRARKAGRKAKLWSGMLGGFPAWGVDGEVAVGKRPARIRTRLVMWAFAPGGMLLTARAEDPGGLGRRRLQDRAAALLVELGRLASGASADPFRALRHGPDAGRWRERYRFRVPPALTVELAGPGDPAFPPPPEAVEKTLFGVYRFLGSGPGSPAPFFRGRVPGYAVEFLPTWPTPEQRSWLARVLGVSEGVGFREAGAPEEPEPPKAPARLPAGDREALDELDGLDGLDELDAGLDGP